MIFGKVDCVRRKNIFGYVLFKLSFYRKDFQVFEGFQDFIGKLGKVVLFKRLNFDDNYIVSIKGNGKRWF